MRDFFFERAAVHWLGLLRILLVVHTGCLGWPYGQHLEWSVRVAAAVPPGLMQVPGPLAWLGVDYPLGAPVLIAYLANLTALMALLGLFTRYSLLLLTVFYVLAMGQLNALGNFNHSMPLSINAFIILAFAPGGDAWSVDRLWRYWRKGKSSLVDALMGPADLIWGRRVLAILLAAVLCSAGVSKLRYSGGAWGDGETLAYYFSGSEYGYVLVGEPNPPAEQTWKDGFGIASYTYHMGHPRILQDAAAWAATKPWLISAISWATVLGEIVVLPLVFLGFWAELSAFVLILLFHAGIRLSMGVDFSNSEFILSFLMMASLSPRLSRRSLAWVSLGLLGYYVVLSLPTLQLVTVGALLGLGSWATAGSRGLLRRRLA